MTVKLVNSTDTDFELEWESSAPVPDTVTGWDVMYAPSGSGDFTTAPVEGGPETRKVGIFSIAHCEEKAQI